MSVFAVSMFSLVAVSIDRWWAVCIPVTYHVTSKQTTRFMIAGCWIMGTVFGFLPMLGWHSGQTQYRCDLRVVADFNYLLFVCVVIGFFSTTVIIVLYILIYRAILRQVNAKTIAF
jgi:7 transmembrane receptor (rhodopsin family)